MGEGPASSRQTEPFRPMEQFVHPMKLKYRAEFDLSYKFTILFDFRILRKHPKMLRTFPLL